MDIFNLCDKVINPLKYKLDDTLIFICEDQGYSEEIGTYISKYFPFNTSKSVQDCKCSYVNMNKYIIPEITEDYEDKNCVIIQNNYNESGYYTIIDALTQVFILIDELKKKKLKSLTVVIPTFPYYYFNSEEYKDCEKPSLFNIKSSKQIAVMLEERGVDNVITIELPHSDIKSYFTKTNVINITIDEYYIECIKHRASKLSINVSDIVIVSTQEYDLTRINKISDELNCESICVNIVRNDDGKVMYMNTDSTIDNKNHIYICETIYSDNTCDKICDYISSKGAKSLSVITCHGMFINYKDYTYHSSLYLAYTSDSCDVFYVSNTYDVMSMLSYNDDTTYIMYKEQKFIMFDISELFANTIYNLLKI